MQDVKMLISADDKKGKLKCTSVKLRTWNLGIINIARIPVYLSGPVRSCCAKL